MKLKRKIRKILALSTVIAVALSMTSGMSARAGDAATLLTGTVFGSASAAENAKAFDKNTGTFFVNGASNGYVGIDLGSGNSKRLTLVRVSPVYVVGQEYRADRISGTIEGSNDGVTYTKLVNVPGMQSKPTEWFEAVPASAEAYRYFRLNGSQYFTTEVAEIEFYGVDASVPVLTPTPIPSTPKPVAEVGKIYNGDFEADPYSAWSNPGGAFSLDATQNHTAGGSKSIKISPAANIWQFIEYRGIDNSLSVPVVDRGTYKVSFWHKGSKNGQLQVADYGNPEGNMLVNDDAEWTYYSKEYFVGTRTELVRFDLKSNNADVTTPSYFDDISLELVSIMPGDDEAVHDADIMHSVAAKSSNMKIGTNFWFLNPGWTGENPFKDNINWATAYANGENIWSSVFLDEIAPYANLRFMDWGQTNDSKMETWSQRTLPSDPNNYAPGSSNPSGLAYEWMIDLCNRTNKDMWICIPHKADDDFVSNLAQMIKTKLNPNLKCYVEYSNEIWNWMFPQTTYCNNEGKKIFTDLDYAYYEYATYRSFQIFDIFDNVFGSQMSSRIDRVCAFSAGVSSFDGSYGRVLNSSKYNPTNQKADSIACAPYVGADIDGYGQNIINKYHVAVEKLLYDYVIPANTMAKKYNADLVTYEGGQHLLSGAQVLSSNQRLYEEYVYMINLYSPYFTLYNHYAHCGHWSSGGSWGALEHTGQSINDAPKYRALVDWIKEPVHQAQPSEALPVGQLSNPSFADGLNGWTSFLTRDTYTIQTGSGTHAHYLEFTNAGDNNGNYLFSSCKLTPNQDYTLYYDIQGVNKAGSEQLCDVTVLDKNTRERLGGKNWPGKTWATQNFEFKAPASGEITVQISVPSQNCTMAFDNFNFVAKGAATPTPAPTPVPTATPTVQVTPNPTLVREAGYLTGTVFGSASALVNSYAFDGTLNSCFKNGANSGYVGIDLGAGAAKKLTKVRVHAVEDASQPWLADRCNGTIEGSNDGVSYTVLVNVPSMSSRPSEWFEANITNTNTFRYFRFNGNQYFATELAELELYSN